MLLAALLSTAARACGVQVLDRLAFLVSLTAAVILLFGYAYLRVAWAALAYLLLMIPIWDGLTESLHGPFQLRSAEIGTWLLRNVGVPAHREGTVIALPNLTIEVARACSGVNYLIAVTALGLPGGISICRPGGAAYLYSRGARCGRAVEWAPGGAHRLSRLPRNRLAAPWSFPRSPRPVCRRCRLRGVVRRPPASHASGG